MKNKLTELIHECEVEALKSNLHLSPERIADYLLEKGVIVTPCVVYNKKHEKYQIVKVGKQLHRFASKFFRTREEAEKALKERIEK